MSPRVLAWSVLTGVAFVLPVSALALLLPTPSAAVQAYHQTTMARPFLHPFSLALLALIIFPLWEELFYRGLLVQVLRRRLPLSVAVVLPNLFFALTHLGQGLSNAFLALLFGLYSSWLCLRTRSLYPSIVCHTAVNFSALFVVGPILAAHRLASAAPMTHALPGALLLPVSLLAGSVAVFVAGLLILRREFRQLRLPLAA